MAATNVPLVAFNGGEIGLESMARVDLDIYPTCAETMENVFPLMQGAMTKAPGTEYIGRTLNDSTAIVRAFIYNVDQTRVLEITDSQIVLVDGNAYVDIAGGTATIGTPADNSSTVGSSVSVAGLNVTFSAAAGGIAAAAWQITGGQNGVETTLRFEIERRPLYIRLGSTIGNEDILEEILLEPGVHVLSFTPTASSYYFRARLREHGKAVLKGITRLAAGELAVPTPWLEAELPGIRTEQSADVFWMYHQNHRTRVLERRANTSWSLRLFRPTDGPFEAPNFTTTALTPAALAGNTTISANAALWTGAASNYIGQLLELTHNGQTETLAATGLDQASESIRVIGVDASRIFTITVSGTFSGTVKLQKSAGNEIDWQDVNSYTAPAGPTSIDDGLDNQIIYYRVVCSAYTSGTINVVLAYPGGSTTGRCEIVGVNSSVQVEVEVYDNFGAMTATTDWSEGAWSEAYGWPAAGALDDGRHAIVRDDRFWASTSDGWEEFEIGVDSADALARRMGTGDVNAARWIKAGKRLLIGTSGAELEVGSSALNEPITPLNSRVRAFDDNGSANAPAIRAGKRVVFIDRTRTRLIQCLMNTAEDADSHDTDDLTRLHVDIAGEVTEDDGGFVDLAYQKRPDPRLYAVRDDGQIAIQLFGPREGVYGWHRYLGAETIGGPGLFKSICVVPGKPEDRVHVIVERVINGETRMCHERFALQKFNRSADAWRLQCALYSTGSPANSFSGLEHLEGETVSVWGDGRYWGDYEVVDGAIELESSLGLFATEDGGVINLEDGTGVALPEDVSTVIIGLNYEGRWKSSKMAYGAQLGSALTMDKEVSRLGIIVKDTPAGAFRYGRSFEAIEAKRGDEVYPSFVEGFTMDSAASLRTEEYNQPFEGEASVDARVCIVMDTPAPVTILALVPLVDVHEQT